MNDNYKVVPVTKTGIILIGIITIVLLVTLFVVFSKLNVFPGNGLLIYSIVVPAFLGILFFTMFIGIKSGIFNRSIAANDSNTSVIKNPSNILKNVLGLLSLSAISSVGCIILYRALKENDRYALIVGVIAIILGFVPLVAILVSYGKAKKQNPLNSCS